MKLYKIALKVFGISLVTGGLVFLGIPYIAFLLSDSRRALFTDSEMSFIPIIMFVIYTLIQFWLTAINLVQAILLHRKGRLNYEPEGIHQFYTAEAVLYLIVFVVTASLFRFISSVVPFILIFSVPYIICCTVSVHLFRRFLSTSLNLTHESQDDTAGAC